MIRYVFICAVFQQTDGLMFSEVKKKQVAHIAIRHSGVPEILKKPSWITSSAGELLKSDILSKDRGVRYRLYTTGCNIS